MTADVAVVGSGISGLLVAGECLRAGRSVVVVERGALVTHADQLRGRRHEADVPGARHNHETAPGTPPYPWDYVYGVGGASLHWTGHTPRPTAEDLRMRSVHGVMDDWPLEHAELERYLAAAEDVLAVAGAGREQPPHPFSPLDRRVADLLQPYLPLPQARPSRPVGSRPACCGEATCALCPVDSRFSALNGLGDVLAADGLDLCTETVAARLVVDGRRAHAVEVVRRGGERERIDARAFVLAASGFENPAILLRSGLARPATGAYLFDHLHRTVAVEVAAELDPGAGASIVTGYTSAFRDGPGRAHRAASIALLFNPGLPLGSFAADALLRGRSGRGLHTELVDRWRRTLVFDVLLEDEPRAERRVTLSPRRDAFGLPLVRVAYPAASRYEREGVDAVVAGLAERLAPLGVRDVRTSLGPAGGHLLGTCRAGAGDAAVVDGDLRHLDVENVWVVGGSAFPTYTPAHPTLTIAALALRAGSVVAQASG